MSRRNPTLLLALLGVCASTVLASAQAASSLTETSSSQSSSTVAYIYVSNAVNSTKNQVHGYSAAANGALTAIPGSPFPDNVSYLSVNGAWLFGAENGLPSNVFSYSIGSNGALTKKDTYTVPNNDAVNSMWLDHTGATLYVDGYDGVGNDYYALSVDQSTGDLTQVEDLSLGPGYFGPLSFIGNNEFAYNSWFYEFDAGILGVQRASDGSLSVVSYDGPPMPTAPPNEGYWPSGAAADPTDHLAIAVEPIKSTSTGYEQAGPVQLATYTADSSGSLTTNSTYKNMPSVLVTTSSGTEYVGYALHYWMSPSGKYLAVGGPLGLQLFHFNGADPITKFTGLITTDSINQLFWDNADHLYAISTKSGKLFVFTVTSKGATQAPGSPHSIASPQNLIVLPK
jgi:hypothetical protein